MGKIQVRKDTLFFVDVAMNQVGSVNTRSWDWNGNINNPNIFPSIKATIPPNSEISHYYIKDGNIMYCIDSTHALAGKTVPMVDFEEWWNSPEREWNKEE